MSESIDVLQRYVFIGRDITKTTRLSVRRKER
jgi:hypothetical protein